MNARALLVVPVLCLAASTVVVAETPAPAPAPRPATTGSWKDPFADRLDALLQQSRAERKRVVLFMHGEEIAGVVLDLGPGWVILSNQPDQQILLRTNQVERAELR
ncbi:MAG: hypothetical protein LKM32_14025 [Chiayiivirga sp.]|jgi:hypothetical protein|uniref:hypothetical protein n=1 Tax=Chiayiivirga sp. TaxID=2041042 RepID=UPI0025C0AFE0|nr:hypothetical protein [Chiayiivirga sp.]MCI1710022.1 hypothetical protein [Chiayiivirga sp.]MCI1730447.1 hypothetical protein [Chiayiivirga sp.]